MNSPLPEPGPGEVRLRVKAIGLNRVEVKFRMGMYFAQPKLPSKLGYETSGTPEDGGAGVDSSWLGKTASTVPAFGVDLYGLCRGCHRAHIGSRRISGAFVL